ncbi:NfeD family protein [Rathayibacter soli]|uniref:NfeD family protein n=1 Tax=Rathayibacter soli TaxID=3144168 RepID=UPI0027E4FB31|nr:NfeD family protein [Glaciibacter superstes]
MGEITSFAWIVWLVLILIFITVEMLTLEFTFLMIAIGSLGGLVSGLFGVVWWGQLLIAAALSVFLLLAIRPPLLRVLKRGADPAKSNVAALIGIEGTVIITMTSAGGQVKLANGETWTAKIAPDVPAQDLHPGERVLVSAIEGSTAVVVPAERNAA